MDNKELMQLSAQKAFDELFKEGGVTKEQLAGIRKGDLVIVPKEPTRLMWAAGGDSIVQSPHRINLHHDEVIKLVWFPMLAEAERQVNNNNK